MQSTPLAKQLYPISYPVFGLNIEITIIKMQDWQEQILEKEGFNKPNQSPQRAFFTH